MGKKIIIKVSEETFKELQQRVNRNLDNIESFYRECRNCYDEGIKEHLERAKENAKEIFDIVDIMKEQNNGK